MCRKANKSSNKIDSLRLTRYMTNEIKGGAGSLLLNERNGIENAENGEIENWRVKSECDRCSNSHSRYRW